MGGNHADGFRPTVALIGLNGSLQGAVHGPKGDEKRLFKPISGIATAAAGQGQSSTDYFGEVSVK
jgi:hypothetical protein